MAKLSRTTKRFRAGKREMLWASVAFNGVSAGVTTATTLSPLVLPGDWTRGTGDSFQKGATLLGIRGWLSFLPLVSSTGTFGSCYAAIVKQEEDEALSFQNFNISTPYNSEDVLWTGGASYSIGAAAPAAATPWSTIVDRGHELAVRSKRKLNSDDTIEFYFTTSTAATDWVVSGIIRSLIALP